MNKKKIAIIKKFLDSSFFSIKIFEIAQKLRENKDKTRINLIRFYLDLAESNYCYYDFLHHFDSHTIIKKFQDFLLENEITNLKIIENAKQIKITFKTLEKDKEFHNNKNHLEFTFSFNNLPDDLIKNIYNDFQEIKKNLTMNYLLKILS